jgi:ATP-dependent Lon protease
LTINELLKKHNIKYDKIKYTGLNKEQLKTEIEKFLIFCEKPENLEKQELQQDVINRFMGWCNIHPLINNFEFSSNIVSINDNMKQITDYMTDVKCTLDKAVHGHDKAKKQIERIIGQWINGEQDGYCFGFEGPPGVGKTSLAKKGLSDCLKDGDGNSRPFAMIQMGGDSNGSTLQGHGYTYVGSSWGSIVQILIDKKCMNPIIFIDEVDKISRTEHGKEIIGILTHLLDTTQNDCFQDKYFTGIDLDLSKALFILSYNDVDAIDKILLDRVHRIKFSSLTLEDKLVISKTHILPEVYKKMGLEDVILFNDEVLKFIIEEYTLESGVRKLKEILFEIVGEINLDILKNNENNYEFPIIITIEDIKTKYFKDKREIIIRKVPEESLVGYANGMYATTLGNGGTLPIHAKFFPSEQFLELKLTGLQMDVMKESMHVSLTVAWNLTSEERKIELRKLYDGENNKYGVNIHPGDGSVQKDGPSAGGIITIVLYSLLNNIPIKSQFAMTGEIQMSGDITAIGGLNYKILGSIKAGVKEFIYPKENKKDFDEFYEKYKNDELLKDIKFYEVNHIKDALELILDK